jgi:hypothetical protein
MTEGINRISRRGAVGAVLSALGLASVPEVGFAQVKDNKIDLSFLQLDKQVDAKTLARSVKDMSNYLKEGHGELVMDSDYKRFYLSEDKRLSVRVAYGNSNNNEPILDLIFDIDKRRLYRLTIDTKGNLVDRRRFLDTDEYVIDYKSDPGEENEKIDNIPQGARRLAHGTILKIISTT